MKEIEVDLGLGDDHCECGESSPFERCELGKQARVLFDANHAFDEKVVRRTVVGVAVGGEHGMELTLEDCQVCLGGGEGGINMCVRVCM